MSYHVFVTYTEPLKCVAEAIAKNTFVNYQMLVEHATLSHHDLLNMAKKCPTEYFYVINSDSELCFPDFKFDFAPEEWDSKYVHIWNNDTKVRLYKTSLVLENPRQYSDEALMNGTVELKSIDSTIFVEPNVDIIFLSYNEDFADKNYETLRDRFPNAKRVNGIKGILEAHKKAAEISTTDLFYLVDADAIIEDEFDFSYRPNGYDMNSVHVWHSRNPVNDLVYGYGGVKLFPKQQLVDYAGSPIDFTTSVSKSFKVVSKVSNITKFNTSPFATWRSAFRECTKLSAKLITNQDNTDTEERLAIWCTKGKDAEFGEYAIMGALAGMQFGTAQKDQPEKLGLINDYDYLLTVFNNTYQV